MAQASQLTAKASEQKEPNGAVHACTAPLSLRPVGCQQTGRFVDGPDLVRTVTGMRERFDPYSPWFWVAVTAVVAVVVVVALFVFQATTDTSSTNSTTTLPIQLPEKPHKLDKVAATGECEAALDAFRAFRDTFQSGADVTTAEDLGSMNQLLDKVRTTCDANVATSFVSQEVDPWLNFESVGPGDNATTTAPTQAVPG
jgi:hypothetical protein